MVRGDEKFDGLIRDCLDLLHERLIVPGELAIHRDQSVGCHTDQGMPSRAGDEEQARLELHRLLRHVPAAPAPAGRGILRRSDEHGTDGGQPYK